MSVLSGGKHVKAVVVVFSRSLEQLLDRLFHDSGADGRSTVHGPGLEINDETLDETSVMFRGVDAERRKERNSL